MENVYIAFLLTVFAGLSTGIGGALVFFKRKTDKNFLSFTLGLSAGVMIYVSLVEILVKAKDYLIIDFGIVYGSYLTVAGFFGGVIFMGIIDRVVPKEENPHEIKSIEDLEKQQKKSMLRMGAFTAIAISIHNFPEGMATFLFALKDPEFAYPVVLAMAIHNIPEGISIAVPILQATNSRKKAFLYSFLSGVSEPLGASIAYLFFYAYINNVMFGLIFAAIAGIMVYISIDELLPSAQKYGNHHLSIVGFFIGMLIMAISLILFIKE